MTRATVSSGFAAFRQGTVGRVVAWLCLLALSLNLVVPVSLAAAPLSAAIAASICHSPDGGAPVAPDRTQGPHCPLCLIGGQVLWVPPGAAPMLAALRPPVTLPLVAAAPERPRRAVFAFHPPSRAPPISA